MFLEADLPFETIDWSIVFDDAHIIRLAVPIVVIHELDRLKRQGGQPVARAARRALRWIEDVRPKAPGAKSINLTPGPRTTLIEIYVDQGPMRRVDADSDIIGFARRLAVLSGQPTKLVTRDLGMRLRAEGAAVEAMQLVDPPTLKLEPAE
jgi:predicted ribonuclease YlaK